MSLSRLWSILKARSALQRASSSGRASRIRISSIPSPETQTPHLRPRTTDASSSPPLGRPRHRSFVLHSQAGLVQHAEDVSAALGYRSEDATLAQVLPFCGVFGFCQMMAALAAGRPSVLLSSFSAAEFTDLIAREEITHANGTDDMWRSVLRTARTGQLSTLRTCGFAAFNGQPEDLVREADRHGVSLVGLYGMSEVQALFSARDPKGSPLERARAGGRLVSDRAAVRVRDPRTGRTFEPRPGR